MDAPRADSPVPVAVAAVRRDDAVLLVRGADGWRLPGAAQRLDETVEATAVRAVREQTGLVVALTGLLDVVSDLDAGRTSVVFAAEERDGELVPGDRLGEAGFLALADRPRPVPEAAHRRTLERLRHGDRLPWRPNSSP